MPDPQVTRPRFPKGYVDKPESILAWEQVEHKLASARHYWLCTVRPNNRPHAIAKWAVWINDLIYFDGSPETRHARNIARNPFVIVHLESGEAVVILEGTAKEVRPSPALAIQLAREYSAKYAALGYSPAADTWDNGGLYEVQPHTVIAWTSFPQDPTKFVFGSGPG